MKTAFIVSFAGLAAAQSISSLVGQIPSCAQAPLLKAIGTTSCATTDYACQCSSANQSKIAAAATPAIEAACSAADIQTVLQISQEICALALAASSSAPAATSAAATSAAASSAAYTSAAAATSYAASSAAASSYAVSSAAASSYAVSSAAASSYVATSAAASSAAVVSQISDGQPQVTAPAPAVSQISDGQVQATAPAPAYTGAAAKAGPVAGAVILAAAAFAL